MTQLRQSFGDYQAEGHRWITLARGEHYPDILADARELYQPVLILFGQLLQTSESSPRLYQQISEIQNSWMRIQLCRVFRKYVSPNTPVELLKKKTQVRSICQQFGSGFRPIEEVQAAYEFRPIPDEAICALLWEYKERGQKGYDLTERLFAVLRNQFPELQFQGPERAGKDILMKTVFKDYPNPNRPVDFAIYDRNLDGLLALGLVRYDSDRGGSQEDDRIGGYWNCARELLAYFQQQRLNTKLIFVNDGPGLLLGSMWQDYASLEESGSGKIMVLTLQMISDRLTLEWLCS